MMAALVFRARLPSPLLARFIPTCVEVPMLFSVRYIHKISPQPGDVAEPIEVSLDQDINCRSLGKILRDSKILLSGERLNSCRLEDDGRIVAFPQKSIWHSIILTPVLP
jgi:hypothetical protein